ncbi:MAG: LTA synthase family protein [Bacteroidetes bacterium]|nr:LTA synthase family protein [Bacteroidota bacterium]
MKFISALLKQFFFWMFLFATTRLIFYVYYWGILNQDGIPISEMLLSFWYAIPLDISTACYILAFPFVLSVIQNFYVSKWLNRTSFYYNIIVIVIYVLISTTEIGIYEEWKTKLQFKALNYLSHPAEIYNSAETSTFFIMLALIITESIFFIWIYNRIIYQPISSQKKKLVFGLFYLIIGSGLLFVGIRGGISEIPITQSKSYFSKHNFINLTSVNSGYSLLISTIENYKFRNKNPFDFYSLSSANARVKRLHRVDKDTTINILTKKQPNIVILILESWSADLIESLGGRAGITPEFAKLENEGLLFTNFYVSGNRSEQSMTSIFAGFPSTPITAISHNLDKIIYLPSFTKQMINEGYSTSYYFGGELMYGGINSFISVNGFERIKEEKDFDAGLPRGKLGLHDEYLFNEQLKELNSESQPFLSVVFTLSTHSPYDQPMEDVIGWADTKTQNNYLNSAYYTDKSLGNYFSEAKKMRWYKNTLFLIVADHSHDTYNHWPVHKKEYRRVPMLLFGDVLKEEFRGTQMDRISSQTDIPVTLLQQLGLNALEFTWSRNLFNPTTPEFAFYESDDGVGWITPDGYFVYSNRTGDLMEITLNNQIKDSVIMDGKSYLQVLFQQFMDY